MISEENKQEIRRIAQEHFGKIEILNIVDVELKTKVELIYNEIVPLYKILSEAKLLPEKIDLDTFFKIVVHQLENAMQNAYFGRAFFI